MKNIFFVIFITLISGQLLNAQLTVSTSNGNVGVKDGSPEEPLTVNGNTAFVNNGTRYVKFRNTWSGTLSSSIDINGFEWKVPNQAGYGADTARFYQLYNFGQDAMFFDDDNVYSNGVHMTIQHGGNVGIGTADPLNPFHVNGDALFNSGVGNLKFGFPTGNGWGYATTGGGATLYLYSYTNTSTEAGQANRVTFKNDGTNGFGTTSPAKTLHAEAPGAGGALRLTRSGSSCILDAGSNISEAFIGTTSNHNFRFLTNGAVQMQIQANGNVGVGTTNPLNKFQVDGDAIFNSSLGILKVGFPTSNGWGFTTGDGGASLLFQSFTNTSTEAGITNRVIFKDNGNNGFGIVSPARPLHAQSTAPGGALRLTRLSSSVILDAGAEVNEAFLGTTSNHPLRLLTNNGVRMVIKSDGNVGVGILNPTFPLHVAGDAYVTGDLTVASDLQLKKDIVPISNALTIINALNPVSFYYRSDEFPTMKLTERKKMGLIAQELEKIIPELTFEAGMVENVDGQSFRTKSVNYIELIPLLVKAVQEMEDQLADKDAQIELLMEKLEKVDDLASEIEVLKRSK